VFKKLLQVATAFGVLVAGYTAYVHVFALVARGLNPVRPGVTLVWGKTESRTAREAKKLAERAFGAGHWAAAEDLQIRLYNSDRGFWLYARDYKRLNDGKQLELSPFAVVWQSHDGKSLKTALSDRAVIDLDKPLGLAPTPGTSGNLRVVHARIEGNVNLRDDKGTPEPVDDLRITGLTHLDYDEPSLQILSSSGLVIEDGDYRITGTGLKIKLRPKTEAPGTPQGSAGFNGAQTAYIDKNIHILIRDVGPAGILPGTSAPAGADPAPAPATAQREPTPLELHADGPTRIDLPKPTTPAPVGPPAPQGPTLVYFSRNVEVLRGRPDRLRDTLTCDNLRLILVPAPKGGAPEKDKGNAPAGESGTSLTLRRADATGQNVWLVSAAQGVKARCNELIHKKLFPGAPDETYFRGDTTSRLVIEKEDVATEGPDKGKVTSHTLIRTVDATIFDDGRGNENATIVARGPGELESRPGRDQPVERTARWLDQLTLQTEVPPAARPGDKPVALKRLTLTGRPAFADLTSKTSLDAHRVLAVWLAPKNVPVAAAGQAKSDPGVKRAGAAYDIQKLVALGNVLLKSPGKTLTARDRLDAEFETPVGPTVTVDARDRPTPTVPGAPSPAKPAAKPAAAGTPPAPAAAPERPAEPEARAIGDRVYAKVWLKPAPASSGPANADTAAPAGGLFGGGAGGKRAEIDKVFLRGAVSFCQDPAPGKAKGTTVTGEAVDLFNSGGGATRVIVFERDPNAPAKATEPTPAPPKAKEGTGDVFEEAVAAALNPANDDFSRLARVETDEMTIRGRVIGLDQATDQAWVDGRGSLTQMASRGLLSDKADPAASGKGEARRPGPAPAASEMTKTPMTITFARGMKFFGQSTDPRNRPAARAEFFEDVHAWTDDASLDCLDQMRIYLDRTVKLTRPKRDPQAPAPAAGTDDSKADVALIECFRQVVAVNVKRDPETGDTLQKERIVCDRLTYEKSTGKFVVPGEGEIFLYTREGNGGGLPGQGDGRNAGNNGRVIRPTSGPGRDLDNPSRPPAVVGHNAVRNLTDRAQNKNQARPRGRALPPLVLTQIHFTREMHGRFGSGQVNDKAETRWADVFGNVEVLRAKVADANAVLDPDDRPADAQSITAQTLRVVSEPPRDPKNPDAPPRYLMRAWEEAYASFEDKTIQADTITYDSQSNLFYAYGEDGNDIVIAQQDRFGQPASTVPGRAAMFNAKSGQAQVVDPKQVAFFDSKTGERPTLVKPKEEKVKQKRPPRAQFRNLRGNIERKDFTGR